jgi:hypothetical protein
VRIAAVALVVLAVAAGCGSSDEQSAPTQPTITDQPPPAASSREPAPALSGESLEGKTVALADFRGRPVLINVWSSW